MPEDPENPPGSYINVNFITTGLDRCCYTNLLLIWTGIGNACGSGKLQ